MKYSELKIKTNEDVNTITINDKQIKVLKYLPMSDKIDLIEITLQKAELNNGIYNEMLTDMYFNLNLIYMYTDLEFSDEDKEDEIKLYDELESNDVIAQVISAIPEEEYDFLVDYMETTKENNETFRMSVISLLQTFIQDMPKNAEAASKIVNNFDKEKYKEVIQFAQNANGGRPI